MQITTCLASREEQRRTMPADILMPGPVSAITHAVTVNAPPERVWPWLAQLGAGRAGWYSYDWIDNGGHPSAKSILPDDQRMAAGDVLPAIPGFVDAFRVAAVEPARRLVLTVPEAGVGTQVSWELLLEPRGGCCTRLIVRGRISPRWPASTRVGSAHFGGSAFIRYVYAILARIPRPLMLTAAGIGHYLMESRMLRSIKRRAER